MNSACRDVPDQTITKYCRENTAHLEEYLLALLASETSPETMCSVVAMCNSDKLDNVLSMNVRHTRYTYTGCSEMSIACYMTTQNIEFLNFYDSVDIKLLVYVWFIHEIDEGIYELSFSKTCTA